MEDYKPTCTPMDTGTKISVYDEGMRINGTLYR